MLQTSVCFTPGGLSCDVRLISRDLFGWRWNADAALIFHLSCVSASHRLAFLTSTRLVVSLLPPAVQSGNASLLLISGVVVPLVFPRLALLILQLAPAGCFQLQPLFSRVPRKRPTFSRLLRGILCVMQCSILMEESGIIKAGLILLWIITHTVLFCRASEGLRLWFLSPSLLFLPSHPFLSHHPLLCLTCQYTFLLFSASSFIPRLIFSLPSEWVETSLCETDENKQRWNRLYRSVDLN